MIWYDSYVVTTSKGGVYMNVTLIVVLVVLAVIILSMISIYNSLIRGRNSVEEAFSTMDIYLKKRFDLIPNLVETVKGYASHEKDTLERVIAARNSIASAANTSEKIEGETALSGALRQIFALSESYPDLKANQNFMDLSSQLKAVEEDIANARKYYNAVVKRYNNNVMMFPSNLIAGMFHFEKAPMFELDDASERKNVKVSF
jgi:LemA protein